MSAQTSTGMDAASLARVSAFTMLALSMVWPLTGFALFVWSLTENARMLGDFGFDSNGGEASLLSLED